VDDPGASRIRIRPLRRSDAAALAPLLRDGQVTRFLPPRVRRESSKAFVARVLREQRAGEGFSFAVHRAGSREAIGQIRLFRWSRFESEAEVGFWLRRSAWGHGYATEALELLAARAFRRERLHRLAATVVEGNLRSARVLEKVGFRREGRRRGAARIDRQWVDLIEFGLLREEWERGRARGRASKRRAGRSG